MPRVAKDVLYFFLNIKKIANVTFDKKYIFNIFI